MSEKKNIGILKRIFGVNEFGLLVSLAVIFIFFSISSGIF